MVPKQWCPKSPTPLVNLLPVQWVDRACCRQRACWTGCHSASLLVLPKTNKFIRLASSSTWSLKALSTYINEKYRCRLVSKGISNAPGYFYIGNVGRIWKFSSCTSLEGSRVFSGSTVSIQWAHRNLDLAAPRPARSWIFYVLAKNYFQEQLIQLVPLS